MSEYSTCLVPALFFAEGRGVRGSVTVTNSPIGTTGMAPTFAASFVDARRAFVEAILRGFDPDGTRAAVFDALADGFLALQPSSVSTDSGENAVMGPSAGPAWLLAIVGLMLGRGELKDVAATGRINERGWILGPLNFQKGVAAKLSEYQSKVPLGICLVHPDNYAPLSETLKVRSRAVASVADLVTEAFGNRAMDELVSRVVELGWVRAADPSERLAPVLTPLCSYFYGDAALMRAFAGYLAACVDAATDQQRAPDDMWVSLGEAQRLRPDRFNLAARAVRLERHTYVEDVVLTGDVDVFAAVPELVLLLRALAHAPVAGAVPAAEARSAIEAAYLRAFQRSLMFRHEAALIQAVTEVARPEDPGDYARRIRNLFGRRDRPVIVTADGIGTEDAIKDGRALVTSTLGGAWLVQYALWGFEHGQPRPVHPRSAEAFPPPSNRRPMDEASYREFREGLEGGAANSGVFALLLERPFAPRVLWETLTKENMRYAAEKLLLADWIRGLGLHDVVHLWNWDALPVVGDFRRVARLYQPDTVAGTWAWAADEPLLGRVGLQDYRTLGRTNLANWWALWDIEPEVFDLRYDSDTLPPPTHDDGPLGWLRWSHVADRDGQWSGGPLAPRSMLVAAEHSLRVQIRINLWLAEPDKASVEELLAVPWTSLASVASERSATDSLGRLDAYLRGPESALAARDPSASRYHPSYDNPGTWPGLGLATRFAYDATIATVLYETLVRIEATLRKSDDRKRHADAEVSLFEIAHFLTTTYRDELRHMHALVMKVAGLLPSDELQVAADRILGVEKWIDDTIPA